MPLSIYAKTYYTKCPSVVTNRLDNFKEFTVVNSEFVHYLLQIFQVSPAREGGFSQDGMGGMDLKRKGK